MGVMYVKYLFFSISFFHNFDNNNLYVFVIIVPNCMLLYITHDKYNTKVIVLFSNIFVSSIEGT